MTSRESAVKYLNVAQCDELFCHLFYTGTTTTSTPTAGCSPRWVVYHNMGTDLARPDMTSTTLKQCLDSCVADSRCVAADWSDVWKCWTHDKYRQPRARRGVTHFRLVPGCKPNSGM